MSRPLRAFVPPCRRASALGYTMIEMLTTVAALVIVLGLMVSLARFVRYRSSTELTKDLLVKLEQAMERYEKQTGQVPQVVPAAPGNDPYPTEGWILAHATGNNQEFVRALRRVQPPSGGIFSDLPVSMYDGHTLRDAWGGLILFLPHQHPAIGIAPHDRFFFFSAGPDRRYLTRDDNLYSYEGR
jgi:hypothetical protein